VCVRIKGVVFTVVLLSGSSFSQSVEHRPKPQAKFGFRGAGQRLRTLEGGVAKPIGGLTKTKLDYKSTLSCTSEEAPAASSALTAVRFPSSAAT